jgi:hypothetical protein
MANINNLIDASTRMPNAIASGLRTSLATDSLRGLQRRQHAGVDVTIVDEQGLHTVFDPRHSHRCR